MKELEEVDFDDTTRGFTKKELLIQKRELVKLQKSLGGIRNLTKTPSAIWIVDTKKEHLAIDEAHKLGIPVIAILDTNCDPDDVAYPIPGNDDAIRSVGLLTRIVADAAAEGLIQRHQKPEEGKEIEPMAAWEAELLGQADADASAEKAEEPAKAEKAEEPAKAEKAEEPAKAEGEKAATADKDEAKAAKTAAAKPAAKKPVAQAADAADDKK
jgi:small subunit ribosomal protein S2